MRPTALAVAAGALAALAGNSGARPALDSYLDSDGVIQIMIAINSTARARADASSQLSDASSP